ncbi:MAG: hypothetical protein LBJ62_01535 [Bifidobacteriaceae bacterium]|jgi:hypothetical protein|nr:hypothetical protein [Bifidobacteriaceae bacterium]
MKLKMDRPFAIAMWDFSWLERRWPWAGYEDWDWILDPNAKGMAAACAADRWIGLCTSNFCGPRFVGMWREVAWLR